MSEEERTDPEDPPFTPEQLVWIDRIIAARHDNYYDVFIYLTM